MISELTGIDTSTPAVVLKFDPNVMHHGALGAIRSLGITVTDADIKGKRGRRSA